MAKAIGSASHTQHPMGRLLCLRKLLQAARQLGERCDVDRMHAAVLHDDPDSFERLFAAAVLASPSSLARQVREVAGTDPGTNG